MKVVQMRFYKAPTAQKNLPKHIHLVLFLGVVKYSPPYSAAAPPEGHGSPITHVSLLPALSGHPGHIGTCELALNVMFRQLNQVFEVLLL